MIIFNIFAFLFGILLGRLCRYTVEDIKRKERYSIKRDLDWHTLMHYYPGDPTDNLSLHKKKK